MAPSPAPATTAFHARGPLSERLLDLLGKTPSRALEVDLHPVGSAAIAASADILRDDDIQVSLFLLYGLHYGGVIACDDRWE